MCTTYRCTQNTFKSLQSRLAVKPNCGNCAVKIRWWVNLRSLKMTSPNPKPKVDWGRLTGVDSQVQAWRRLQQMRGQGGWDSVSHYLTHLTASEADRSSRSSLMTGKIWKNGASTNVSMWINAKIPGEFINTEVYGIGTAFKRYKKLWHKSNHYSVNDEVNWGTKYPSTPICNSSNKIACAHGLLSINLRNLHENCFYFACFYDTVY